MTIRSAHCRFPDICGPKNGHQCENWLRNLEGCEAAHQSVQNEQIKGQGMTRIRINYHEDRVHLRAATHVLACGGRVVMTSHSPVNNVDIAVLDVPADKLDELLETLACDTFVASVRVLEAGGLTPEDHLLVMDFKMCPLESCARYFDNAWDGPLKATPQELLAAAKRWDADGRPGFLPKYGSRA